MRKKGLVLFDSLPAGGTDRQMLAQPLLLVLGQLARSGNSAEFQELVMGFGVRQRPSSSDVRNFVSYCWIALQFTIKNPFP